MTTITETRPHWGRLFQTYLRRAGVQQKELADEWDCNPSRITQLLKSETPPNSLDELKWQTLRFKLGWTELDLLRELEKFPADKWRRRIFLSSNAGTGAEPPPRAKQAKETKMRAFLPPQGDTDAETPQQPRPAHRVQFQTQRGTLTMTLTLAEENPADPHRVAELGQRVSKTVHDLLSTAFEDKSNA